MMNDILLLMNYKNVFGSKHFSDPYRSGFSTDKIKKYLMENGISNVQIRQFSDVNFDHNAYSNNVVLYTSSEDIGYHYKSYIEDIIFSLEKSGAKLIPQYKFLRANNNKVYMEILRSQCSLDQIKNIKSRYFGTLEEALSDKWVQSSNYPKVLKLAEGGSGKNVEIANSFSELRQKIKKIARTRHLYQDLWDFGRSIIHKGYQRESLYRNKFIIQDFIPNLENDWKIYVFYNNYFIFYRPIFKKRKFIASGGGYENYSFGLDANPPEGIFDFARQIREEFNVPHLSLDIAWDGNQFYLLEFQFVYFGTAGVILSDEYFTFENGNWIYKNNPKDIEYFYVDSTLQYLKQNNL